MTSNVTLSIDDYSISNKLQSLQKQLTYILLVPLFLIGNIGCIFNTLVFLRPYLRSSSCSRYFLASSFANAFQLNVGLASHLLDFAFNIHPHYRFSILCKFRNYSINTAGFLSQTYLLLACADRYLITMNKSYSRRLHRVPIADRIILFTALFWFLSLSHMLVYSDVSSQNQFCFYSSSSYIFFLSFHNLILSGFFLPILMVVFSVLALRNIRRIQQHIRSRHHRRRRHHYLSLMLISNVFVSVIFTMIYTSGLIYITFFSVNRGGMSSVKEKAQRRFVVFLSVLFYYVPYAISFYVNVLTSERFRHELSKILFFRRNKKR